MRIALITPGFSSHADPWCIPLLRNLAIGLSRSHDVHVYSAYYPPCSGEYRLHGVPVSSFGRRRTSMLTRISQERRLVAAVRRHHARKPFDVVHGFWADQGGRIAVRAARSIGAPSLISVMAGELDYIAPVRYGKRHRISGLLGRRTLRKASSVVAISSWHHTRLERNHPGLNVALLAPGVDTDLFRPDGAAREFDSGMNILVVGSLVPVKGHEVLLRALAIARSSHPCIRLHIAGEGPMRSRLELRVRELALQEYVNFLGHVEHDSLPRYYRSADFCVLGSWFETSALVLFEAAACGCPTVGSETGSLAELVPPDLRSVPGDALSLAAVIEKIATSPERRRQLGDAAVAVVRERYTLELMIERYASEYRRILQLTGCGEPDRCPDGEP